MQSLLLTARLQKESKNRDGRIMAKNSEVRCSFCNKTQDQVRKLIAGPAGVYICDECVDICADIIEEEYDEEEELFDSEAINLLKPVEIKEHLDEYVIVQEEAKKVLASWEHARQCISGFHAGITGQLAIGYKHVYGVETWMNTLSAFQTRYPQIALDIQSFSGFDEIHDSLLSGKIDIAMTLSLDEFVSPAFRMLTLESAPLYASMSVTNPLIEKHTLLCGDLAAETLIFPHTNNHLSIAKILRGFFRSRGLNPKVAYSAKNMDEAIMRVRLNNYINIVPKCYFPHDTDNFYGIRSIEIEDTANLFRLLILARKDNQNPAINLFFSLCQESISSSEK